MDSGEAVERRKGSRHCRVCRDAGGHSGAGGGDDSAHWLEFQQCILKCLEFSSANCMCALFARSGVVHANSSAVRR